MSNLTIQIRVVDQVEDFDKNRPPDEPSAFLLPIPRAFNPWDLEDVNALIERLEPRFFPDAEPDDPHTVTWAFESVPEGFTPIVVHVPPLPGATLDGNPIVDTGSHRFGQFDSLKPIGRNRIRGVVGEGSHPGHLYVFWLWPTEPNKEAIRLWCDDGPGPNRVGTFGAVGTPPPDPGPGGQGGGKDGG